MAILSPGAIHIWMMRRPRDEAGLRELTTAAEQQYADTLTSNKRRCEWLAGRALLRHCLAHYTGRNALALTFEKTGAGKPFLDLPDAPAFNLSHGPGWIACAVVCAESIGIDIDSDTRKNRTEEIAARFFHPQEQLSLLRTVDVQVRQQKFFKLWTLKEAYIKSLGQTINSVRLHDIAFDIEAAAPRALFDLPEGHWQFYHRVFDRHHHLALACRRAGCDTANVELWLWDATTQSRRELTEETLC